MRRICSTLIILIIIIIPFAAVIHNGRRFTAQIHDNPAYGNRGSSAPRTTSHVHNPGNDDQQTTSSAPHVQEDHIELSHSHTRRLDHTYETVR